MSCILLVCSNSGLVPLISMLQSNFAFSLNYVFPWIRTKSSVWVNDTAIWWPTPWTVSDSKHFGDLCTDSVSYSNQIGDRCTDSVSNTWISVNNMAIGDMHESVTKLLYHSPTYLIWLPNCCIVHRYAWITHWFTVLNISPIHGIGHRCAWIAHWYAILFKDIHVSLAKLLHQWLTCLNCLPICCISHRYACIAH